MHTYTFKTVSGGRAKINAGSGFFVPKSNPGIFENSDSVLLNFNNEDDLIIYPANDTVIIDGTTHAAGSWSVTAMSDAINVLFPKANSSSGGTGAGSGAIPSFQQVTDAGSTTTNGITANEFTGHFMTVIDPNNAEVAKVTYNDFDGQNFGGALTLKSFNGGMLVIVPSLEMSGDVTIESPTRNGRLSLTDDVPNFSTLLQFDSNAEAVAALGVGKLYKSTTLINGSPIILITV